MASPATCPPCDCSDSPLSMTGNIVGIITFAYVLIIGLSYRASAIAHADGDIRNLAVEAMARHGTLDHWLEESTRISMTPTPSAAAPTSQISEARTRKIRAMLGATRDAREELDKLQIFLATVMGESGRARGGWWKYWVGWRFLRKRDELRGRLARVDVMLAYAKAVSESQSNVETTVEQIQHQLELLQQRMSRSEDVPKEEEDLVPKESNSHAGSHDIENERAFMSGAER